MRCDELIKNYRTAILQELDGFLSEKQKELGSVNSWGFDCCVRLKNFVGKGKLLRGCLVVLGCWLVNKNVSSDVIKAAAAMELIHSSLLIHDDIMDNDSLRRGLPTMFAQYVDKMKECSNPRRVGESLGMCVGDVGFFLAFELLSSLKYEKREKVVALVAKEVAACGVAQMQDVVMGVSAKATVEEVLQVYLFKTARYSFSLPLAMGASIAGQNESVVKNLESFGGLVGVAFQIKDDYLGIFGDEKTIGKPVGSDIREGKKTLFWLFLLERASKEEMAWLESLAGSETVSKENVEKVKALLAKYGIIEKINSIVEEKKRAVDSLINAFSADDDCKEILRDVWRLAVERNS